MTVDAFETVLAVADVTIALVDALTMVTGVCRTRVHLV